MQQIEDQNKILSTLVSKHELSSVQEPVISTKNNSFKYNEDRQSSIEADSTTSLRSVNVVQANIHPILFMSESDFTSTSLGEMMSWYGEATGGDSCPGDFGNALVKRWRSERKNNCSPRDVGMSSNIDCFLVHQTRHAGGGDNICLMNNVAIKLGLYSDDSYTIPVVEHYVNTRHAQQPYIHFNKGFILANCDMDESLWKPQSHPGWNVDWEYNAVDTVSVSNDDMKCLDTVDHNVLIMQRDTFANFFHDSEDFFNSFLTMAVLEWSLKDTQIYLTDLYPNGPFWCEHFII